MMKSLNMYIRWDTRLRGNLYTNYTKQVNSASNKYFCATTSKSQTVLHHCYPSIWFVFSHFPISAMREMRECGSDTWLAKMTVYL